MRNRICGIYQIQSKIKYNKIYVGSAIDIYLRWLGHIEELRKNKHHNPKLQCHYNKYGESDLQFSILLGCEKEDLLKYEQFFIDSLNPWFNIQKVAGSPLGKKMSDEEKRKHSEAMKGINTWMNGRIPWNKGKKGLQVSWRKGLTGFKESKETRKKKSESAKKAWARIKAKHNGQNTINKNFKIRTR